MLQLGLQAKKKGLLHIRQISDAGKYREGPVKGLSSIVKEIMAELEVERAYHSSFDSFGGSLLCSYPVKQIEPRSRGKWIEHILQNHHSAIFVTKPGQG